jgi:hypothetical protein
MDDGFMLTGLRMPRPDFVRRVRARLHQLEAERGPTREPRTTSLAAACAASLVLVVGAFAFPSVRAGARAFLDLFRVVNFAPVPVQADRINALIARQELDLPRVLGEQAQVLKAPGARQTVANAEAAGTMAGIRVRLPAWQPVGLELQRIEVSGDQMLRVTVSTEKLQRILDSFAIDDLSVPPEIDGQSATLRVPAVVRISYGDQNRNVVLLQARQPVVSFPAGVDLPLLAEIGLRVLGIERVEAHRFAQNVNWRTTLIVPVLADASVFRQVDVQGNAGLLIETVRNGASAMLPAESRVLWSSGDSVFALVGNVRPEELFEMAQSVQ